MAVKPRTAGGYGSAQLAHVRATCLYVATKLGDLVDELVIVGGLVPSLIVDQAASPTKDVGTADLDIGLALAVLDGKRYQILTERDLTAALLDFVGPSSVTDALSLDDAREVKVTQRPL